VYDDEPEQRRRAGDTPLRHPLVTHTFTSLLSAFIVAFFAYNGQLKTSETDQLSLAFERISLLEGTLSARDQQIASLRADIIILKAQMSTGGNPMVTVYKYMDNMERPAWIKVYQPEENTFRMLHINPAYEQAYKVTNDFYRGRTDEEVHGDQLARKFLTLDLQVIGRRDFRASEELVSDGQGGTKVIEVWKWFVPLPDGRMAVAGIQISER